MSIITLDSLFPNDKHALEYVALDSREAEKITPVATAIKNEIDEKAIKWKLNESWKKGIKGNPSLLPFPVNDPSMKFAIAGGHIGDLLHGENSKDIDIFIQIDETEKNFDHFFLQNSAIYNRLFSAHPYANPGMIYDEHRIDSADDVSRFFFDHTESGSQRDYFYLDIRDKRFSSPGSPIANMHEPWFDRAHMLAMRLESPETRIPTASDLGSFARPVKKITSNSVSFIIPDSIFKGAVINLIWKKETIKLRGEHPCDVINDFDFLHTTLSYDPENCKIIGLNLQSFIAAKYKILALNPESSTPPTPERTAKFIERGYNYSLLPAHMINEAEKVLRIWRGNNFASTVNS